jgi:uncharacterized membrane protein
MKKEGKSNDKKSFHVSFAGKGNQLKDEHPIFKFQKTFGQRAADKLTEVAGSWSFIFGFLAFLAIWIATDFFLLVEHPADQYPFIILNLILSSLAAIQAPIILMSQNRQGEKDRLRAQYDYSVDKKAEKEIQEIKEQLVRIEKLFKK